jgi:hypothetical protein
MKRSAKQSGVILASTSIVCAFALWIAQGRLLPNGLPRAPALEKPFFDSCYVLSLPGVMAAIAIWGYNADRTFLSDALIVAVNTALYGLPMILTAQLVRYLRTRNRRQS